MNTQTVELAKRFILSPAATRELIAASEQMKKEAQLRRYYAELVRADAKRAWA